MSSIPPITAATIPHVEPGTVTVPLWYGRTHACSVCGDPTTDDVCWMCADIPPTDWTAIRALERANNEASWDGYHADDTDKEVA